MPMYQPLHLEDLALVARIVNGDEDAAQEFYQTYTHKFAHLVQQRGIPYQDCQDVVQDALCDAYRQMQRGQFRGASKLSTWLWRILNGKIAEYYRHYHSNDADPLDDDDWAVSHEKQLPRIAIDPEFEMIIREALMRMPLQSRAIILLKHTDGWTLEEISRIMDIRLAQASGRLYSAEEMFRRCLKEGLSSSGKRRHNGKALLASDSLDCGEFYVRSISHQSKAGLPVTGHQSVIDSLLFRASQRTGITVGRRAFAGVRDLLAGSAAYKGGGAGSANRQKPAANAHA